MSAVPEEEAPESEDDGEQTAHHHGGDDEEPILLDSVHLRLETAGTKIDIVAATPDEVTTLLDAAIAAAHKLQTNVQ